MKLIVENEEKFDQWIELGDLKEQIEEFRHE